MATFEERTARAGMNQAEIQKFVGDFTDALVKLALPRLQAAGSAVRNYGSSFDSIAGSLDWTNAELLATAGVDIAWLADTDSPQRIFMHPDFTTQPAMWAFKDAYLEASMVSKKSRAVLFPNLARKRRPRNVPDSQLLHESKLLNYYLHLVHEAGFSGDRIIAYHEDVKIHGQGQNDSGKIGTVGAAVAIRDALAEISPNAIIDTYGTIPLSDSTSPEEVVKQIRSAGYSPPKALLLSSELAIIFAPDPDIAIVARIGKGGSYESAQQAYEHWGQLKKNQRSTMLHQAAYGEVKAALDRSNMHERIALASRERPREVRTERFLLMAILTPEILTEDRRDVYNRFNGIFNLYFTWGYDSARENHPEHWEDFKSALKGWAAL